MLLANGCQKQTLSLLQNLLASVFAINLAGRSGVSKEAVKFNKNERRVFRKHRLKGRSPVFLVRNKRQ